MFIPELALVCKFLRGKGEFPFLYDSKVLRPVFLFPWRDFFVRHLECELINWKLPIQVPNPVMPRLIRSFLPATISNYEFTSHGGIIGGK